MGSTDAGPSRKKKAIGPPARAGIDVGPTVADYEGGRGSWGGKLTRAVALEGQKVP
jgi:hypothetical protein